jgi:hypothetical protein
MDVPFIKGLTRHNSAGSGRSGDRKVSQDPQTNFRAYHCNAGSILDMNWTQLKCLLVFGVFAGIGFGPVSPGCLIGTFSVMARPPWMLRVVRSLYQRQQQLIYPMPSIDPKATGRIRIKAFLSFLILFIIDIAPYPVTPSIAIPIILIRPRWFFAWVERIYAN